MEGVKTDAQRQSNVQGLEGGPQQCPQVAQEKVCIFKEEEHPHGEDDREHQECHSDFAVVTKALDAKASCIVDQNGGKHNGHVAGLPPGIEEEATDKKYKIFELFRRQIIGQKGHRHEPKQEHDAAKNQWDTPLLF